MFWPYYGKRLTPLRSSMNWDNRGMVLKVIPQKKKLLNNSVFLTFFKYSLSMSVLKNTM